MTEDELKALVKQANERLAALTPEQQKAHWSAQRDSWVRSQMALSAEVKKHTNPDGSVTYEDYASYCLD